MRVEERVEPRSSRKKRSNLEVSCACNIIRKFAHNRCLQKWCNVKDGITTCEICKQVYPILYTPEQRSYFDMIVMCLSESLLHPEDERSFAATNRGPIIIAFVLFIMFVIHYGCNILKDLGIFPFAAAIIDATAQIAAFVVLPCLLIVRFCSKLYTRRKRRAEARRMLSMISLNSRR